MSTVSAVHGVRCWPVSVILIDSHEPKSVVGFIYNHLTCRLPFQFVSCILNLKKKRSMYQVDIVHQMAQINETIEIFHRIFLSLRDAIFLKLSSSVRCRRIAFTFQIKIVFKINVNNYNRHTNNAVTLMIQFQGQRSYDQKFTIEIVSFVCIAKVVESRISKQTVFISLLFARCFCFLLLISFSFFHFLQSNMCSFILKVLHTFIFCLWIVNVVYLDLDRGPDSMTFRLYSFQCPRNCNQFYYGN